MQTQKRRLVGGTVAAFLLGMSGCSSSGRVLESTAGHTTGTGGTSGDTGASGGKSSGGATIVGGSGGVIVFETGGAGFDASLACGAEAFKAEALPVDFYLMLDQSSSMGDPLPGGTETWWSALQAAVDAFVNAPRAAGNAVGIQYFPLSGVAPASCAADYATPEVEIGLLPGNAAAIMQSVASHAPSAFTPTAPALRGAIAHLKTWAPSHVGRAPVVVFITDGFPTECDPQQITDIAAIAQAAFETEPKVRTAVVGLNLGQAGQNLDSIAQAGGTGKAMLIDGGDIGVQLTNTMLSIVFAPSSCAFDIPTPPAGTLDPNLVTVRYAQSGEVDRQLPRVSDVSACQGSQVDGWYYDDPLHPTKLVLCPATCGKPFGGLSILYGCVASPP